MAMNEKWTMHVVPHSHWDREWYYSYEEFRYRLVKMFDRLLALMEEGVIEYFTADGHTRLIDDYLEIRPEKEPALRKLLKDGRILIGPWYIQPNIFMSDAESQVRNLLRGRREMAKWGGGMAKIDYLPDQFGFHTQLPQLHKGFGITHLVGARGMPKGCPNAFRWVGADGTETEVLALWHSYHSGNGLSPRMEAKDFPLFGGTIHMPSLPERLDNIILEKQRAVAPHLLAMNGVDHMYPNPEMRETLAQMEKLHPEVKAVQSTLPRYAEEMDAETVSPLARYEGELRDPREEHILTASQSMRMDIKKFNGVMQDLLERRVEPMLVKMRQLGEDNLPMAHLDKAWELLLLNHAHDSLCCANKERSYREIYSRYEQALSIAENIDRELNQRFIRRIRGLAQDAVVAMNPVARERDEAMTFEVIVSAQDSYAQPHLFFGDREIPVYIQSVRGDSLLRFVPFSGWVGQIPVRVFTLTADTGTILPMGYKAFDVRMGAPHPKPVDGIVRGRNALENERLRVEVNSDGTLDIADKANGRLYAHTHYFISDGETGCGFMHLSPVGDVSAVSAGDGLSISIVENNPLKGTLRVRQTMRVPGDLTPDMSARAGEATLEIISDITLCRGCARVEFVTTVNNTAKNHRFRVAFPTDIQADACYAGQPYDVVYRPVQPENVNVLEEGDFEPYYGWQPMQNFCGIEDDSRGVAVAADGVLEYEALPMRKTLCLTLIRATDRLHVGVLATGSEFKLPAAQLQGEQKYRYAFVPHEGGYENALDEIERFRYPAYVAQKDFLEEQSMPDYTEPAADLPACGGFLNVSGGAAVTAVKPAEDGRGFILRLYNPLNRTVRANVEALPPLRFAALGRVRMDETDEGETTAQFDMRAKEIVTIRVNGD